MNIKKQRPIPQHVPQYRVQVASQHFFKLSRSESDLSSSTLSFSRMFVLQGAGSTRSK